MIICSTVVLRCYGSGKLVGVCNPGRNVLDLKDMQNVSNGVANPVTLIVPKLWFGNQRNYIYAVWRWNLIAKQSSTTIKDLSHEHYDFTTIKRR